MTNISFPQSNWGREKLESLCRLFYYVGSLYIVCVLTYRIYKTISQILILLTIAIL